MKISISLFFALFLNAHAASVLIPAEDLESEISRSITGTAPVSTSNTTFVDLSDLSSLTEDRAIEIVLSMDSVLFTFGINILDSGLNDVFMQGLVRLEVDGMLVEQPFFQNITGSDGPFDFGVIDPTPSLSSVVGYLTAEVPDLRITVPWETDLSAVSVSLLNQSTFFNPDIGNFFQGTIVPTSASLETFSSPIPEPSTSVWYLLASFPILVRRRRA